jgi:hypothetical protein
MKGSPVRIRASASQFKRFAQWEGILLERVTPRWHRITMFVFAGVWAGLGVWALSDGHYAQAGLDLALGVAWLSMAFFRDRFAPRFEAALERQRARVKGHGAMSFLPDPDSHPQSK